LPTPCDAWAGNGFEVYKDRLNLASDMAAANPTDNPVVSPANFPVICAFAMPHALALLRLAPAQWASGKAVAPEHVQPLYIRDKVAQTTAEREAIKASKLS
jgi:tRNA A37 threonylcarbamoyladenosine modification protein TsaB